MSGPAKELPGLQWQESKIPEHLKEGVAISFHSSACWICGVPHSKLNYYLWHSAGKILHINNFAELNLPKCSALIVFLATAKMMPWKLNTNLICSYKEKKKKQLFWGCWTMLLLHDAHVLSPCLILGLFASQKRQTAENSQETVNCKELVMWVLISYSKQTLSLGTKAATEQSNSIPTLPSVITPAAQWDGKHLVMDKTRQD